MPDAQSVIESLGLQPHPEGGFYLETWRASTLGDERPAGTAIYYLLRAGERSHWHRVDAAETWHFYAGDPLVLSVAATAADTPKRHLLGADLDARQRPQVTVPAGEWQSAEPLGEWTLVGCTVAPGFRFDGFELADPDWVPGRGR